MPFSSSIVCIVISTQCGDFCVACQDGDVIRALIQSAFDEGKKISLSFAGIKSLSSAFLMSAIGELLENFSENELNARLKFEDISLGDRATLNRVVENAKRYYANPERYIAFLKELEEAY